MSHNMFLKAHKCFQEVKHQVLLYKLLSIIRLARNTSKLKGYKNKKQNIKSSQQAEHTYALNKQRHKVGGGKILNKTETILG